MIRRGRRCLILAGLVALAFAVISLPQRLGRLFQTTAVAATTFTVNSVADTSDSNTADGVCNDGSGNCTLRAAIEQANATAGTDTINFSIGTGAKTIVQTSDFPVIADPVIIDGTTQPGFAGTPIIEINGNNRANTNRAGFSITAGSSTIRGLVINRVNSTAISLDTNGGNHIEGNYIGTDITGTQVLANKFTGVAVNTSSNVIGGTTASTRNVISGNNPGIGFNGSITNNLIQGNYIGVDATGSVALGNSNGGITVTGSSNHIGGTAAGAGNLISGNSADGILLAGSAQTVEGNFIGTNAAGTVAVANSGPGIQVQSSTNVIGGTSPASRNIISGNIGAGISIEIGKNSNTIQGNFIGTDVTGLIPVPNSVPSPGFGTFGGIEINRSSGNLIGGSVAGAANLIAFNGGAGVWVFGSDATNNRISGNSIFGNLVPGIDLFVDVGVTPNDPGDADTGPNNLQNFPLITSVVAGAATAVNGTLNSTANSTFEIEFFANQGCHASGNGEGARFLGRTTVTTDGSGNVSFSAQVGASNANEAITATATDANGNTSEFSPCDATKARGIVQFAKGYVYVREDLSVLNLQVVRIGGSAGSVTVNYATVDDVARAGQDYTAVSGTLTFADGETSKTIAVPITNDNIAEISSGETFFVRLSNATTPELVGADGTCVVRIFDPNFGATLSYAAASKIEGNSGTSNVLITVSLSVAISQTVTVNYQTGPNISATSGVDYLPVSGTLTFAPGVTDQQFAVPIIGDTIKEADEQFLITLFNAVNASVSVGSNQPRITIVDDDPAPAISISDAGVVEPSTGTAPAVFNIVLSNKSSVTVGVNFATADGSATAGSDYQSNSGTLVFSPGETSKQVTVQVNADATVEPNETFFVNLTNPLNGTIADSQGIGTIAPANSPSIQFGATSYSVAEPAYLLPITVTRSGDTSAPASVQYQTADGSATYHGDYTPAFGVLTFAAGETSKMILVLVNEDGYQEGDETFTINLTNAKGAFISGPTTATVTIQDFTFSASNPVDDASFFVRQHYHDFLNREPDQSGLDFWTGQITACGNDAACKEVKRINVSGAFFLSIEFQQTGYLVERIYKTAYGDATGTSTLGGSHQLPVPVVRFTEFLQDTQRIGRGVIVLQPGWEQALENNKQAYAQEFVQTSRFISAFPMSLTPTQFVDQLNTNAGNVLSASERTAAINLFSGAADSSNTTARAQALRQVAEDQDLYNAEFNRAFVLTQFFGYLRRNPNDPQDTDYTGYDFWLTKLNQFNGDYIAAEMVKAFIASGEYRQRFGQ